MSGTDARASSWPRDRALAPPRVRQRVPVRHRRRAVRHRANAFALANQLPTYVYAIVAGGLLSAVLVPHIVRAATAADGGEAFINRLMTLGISAFLVTTAVATVGAPVMVRLYAIGGSDATLRDGGLELAIALAYGACRRFSSTRCSRSAAKC